MHQDAKRDDGQAYGGEHKGVRPRVIEQDGREVDEVGRHAQSAEHDQALATQQRTSHLQSNHQLDQPLPHLSETLVLVAECRKVYHVDGGGDAQATVVGTKEALRHEKEVEEAGEGTGRAKEVEPVTKVAMLVLALVG